MPAIPPDSAIGKNVATFSFLCKAPILEINPTLEGDECAICKDSYRNNGWRLGGTLHCPVILRCGHVFGFQCLARWMLTANFDDGEKSEQAELEGVDILVEDVNDVWGG